MRIEQVPKCLEKTWIRIYLVGGKDFCAFLLKRVKDHLLVRNREHLFKVALPKILNLDKSPQKVQECIRCGNIMHYKNTRYKKCTICNAKLPRNWLSNEEVSSIVSSSALEPSSP